MESRLICETRIVATGKPQTRCLNSSIREKRVLDDATCLNSGSILFFRVSLGNQVPVDKRAFPRGLKPTLKNSEMLVRAYQYYSAHRKEIEKRSDVSAHSKPASMGVIKLLKWIS